MVRSAVENRSTEGRGSPEDSVREYGITIEHYFIEIGEPTEADVLERHIVSKLASLEDGITRELGSREVRIAEPSPLEGHTAAELRIGERYIVFEQCRTTTTLDTAEGRPFMEARLIEQHVLTEGDF